jgi:hypothetical protein
VAGGGEVLAAGEVYFDRDRRGLVSLSELTNQSTGYCPEPSSFAAVAPALARLGLVVPDGYTQPFTFRRCPSCAQINLVKEAWFTCDACGAALPEAWNFDTGAP